MAMNDMIAQQIVSTMEAAVDAELNKLDTLDDSDLAKIRRARFEELKKAEEDKASWRSNGHGALAFISDEKEFFQVAKGSRRVVAHFSKSDNVHCNNLNDHLRRIAEHHMECKFIVVDAAKSPFLVERLKIWMIPSLVLIKDGKTEKTYGGLDWVHPSGNFPTWVLERRLFDEEWLDNKPLEQKATEQLDEDLDWGEDE